MYGSGSVASNQNEKDAAGSRSPMMMMMVADLHDDDERDFEPMAAAATPNPTILPANEHQDDRSSGNGEKDGTHPTKNDRQENAADQTPATKELDGTSTTSSPIPNPKDVDNLTPRQLIQAVWMALINDHEHDNDIGDNTIPRRRQNVKDLWNQLEILDQSAVERIQTMQPQNELKNGHITAISSPSEQPAQSTITPVEIPHIPSTIPITRTSCLLEDDDDGETMLEENAKKGIVERKDFYRALRQAFPLLQSVSNNKNGMVEVFCDTFYDELIPYLYNPHEDLLDLFQFAKNGIDGMMMAAAALKSSSSSSKMLDPNDHPRGMKRKRDERRPTCTNDGTQAILRLIPDLPRDQRRPVHTILSKKNKDFQTSTINDYPLENQQVEKGSRDGSSNNTTETTTTTAIVVKWSQKAIKKSRNNKNNNNNKQQSSPGSAPPHPNKNPQHTLCVLKKTGKEHLTAIQHVCSALNCRPRDIGLAGIKDMKAVTYQFCTLRNMSPDKVWRQRRQLHNKGIQLGKFRAVDYMLQNGDLQGNRFVIMVRNLQRVSVVPNNDDKNHAGATCAEQMVPCERQHATRMFERIRRSGFVNFYGEQRVGAPGCPDQVGVRSFDVGRAMLQHDFDKAIDLILTGRKSTVQGRGADYQEHPEETRMRNTWRESGGDADATLKVFPKGEAMPRERAILKGIKRYGKDKPLMALQCLPNSVRSFWINAYQSYVWNVMASARVQQYGSAGAVIGDLFVEFDEEEKKSHHGHRQSSQTVKVVTAENVASVKMDQVVLPLPGYSVQYPQHAIGDLYRKMLQDDKIHFEKKEPQEATAKGAYRHVIVRPTNMEVSFPGEDDEGSSNSEDCVSSMTLKFDLVAGSYATMLLRELMLTTVARNE